LDRLVALAFAASITVLCASCGLDTTVGLASPSFYSSSPNSLTLTHAQTNDSSTGFLGYEVYYHVYPDTSAGMTAAQNDYSTITSTVQNSDVYTPATALSYMTATKGFMRLFVTNAQLFFPDDTNKNNVYTISLDVNNTDWYFANGDNSYSGNIYRNCNNNTTVDSNVSFNTTYTTGDYDYFSDPTAPTSSGTGATIHILFFAVSYGMNFSSFSNFYSYPTICSTGGINGYLDYTLPSSLQDGRPPLQK
jgi:hypothetical protein